MNSRTQFSKIAARLLASSGVALVASLLLPATASATSLTTNTVGTVNGNSKTIFEATGNTVTSTTFASDIATAFANNTGGVWSFEDSGGFSVNPGETMTLNYGTSLANSLVLTLSGTDGINQSVNGGEAVSGGSLLGLTGNGAPTRTFTSNTGLLEVGIFNGDRNDSGRIPVLTVTFQDTTTASTSGANADDVYFHGFKTTAANPILSFSLSQNNFVRYDDLGFIVVPEPGTFGMLLVGLCTLQVIRRKRG